jgi:hypothetical protein
MLKFAREEPQFCSEQKTVTKPRQAKTRPKDTEQFRRLRGQMFCLGQLFRLFREIPRLETFDSAELLSHITPPKLRFGWGLVGAWRALRSKGVKPGRPSTRLIISSWKHRNRSGFDPTWDGASALP